MLGNYTGSRVWNFDLGQVRSRDDPRRRHGNECVLGNTASANNPTLARWSSILYTVWHFSAIAKCVYYVAQVLRDRDTKRMCSDPQILSVEENLLASHSVTF